MRIVIDMQGAQSTGSRNRGIGRYTLSIVKAMIRQRGEHEIVLTLNGRFLGTIEALRAAFDGLLPQENIRVWQMPTPTAHINPVNVSRRQAAELAYEGYLAGQTPDFIYVTSLFEGLGDDTVTGIHRMQREVPVAVTLYDLIPYINPVPYFESPHFRSWYMDKIEHLRRADLWLAISESSRQEGIIHLGLSKERSINISTDADEDFRPIEISGAREQVLRARYGLRHPFVMCTGGIDYRKNIEGLISAYARLPESVRRNHQLAVVCSLQPLGGQALEQIARNHGLTPQEVVLTGFVPDDDLVALYNLCKLFVFPSWHEGFGLPVLEAMRCGAPVIGADTSSLPEVIGWDEALFDPYSDKSMAQLIRRALTDEDFREALVRHGNQQAKQFSWDKSARHALSAMQHWHRHPTSNKISASAELSRRKLAYLSPLPPARSGIADYSAELLPELAKYYDIDVIVDQEEAVNDPWVSANSPLRTIQWFVEHANRYDRILYHFGNSAFHKHMFELLDNFPGVVVLHDFYLSHIQRHGDALGWEYHSWAQALQASHGYSAVIDRYSSADTAEVAWRYPANLPVLQRAMGVIVHSSYSCKLAQHWYGDRAGEDWFVIPLLRTPPKVKDREVIRRSLGLSPDDLLVCSFGIMHPMKLNHRLLHAWLNSPLSGDGKAHLVFVGENQDGDYGQYLRRVIDADSAPNHVKITGWADANSFRNYLVAADIGVQLRTLSRGETSAAVLDCMNYGLATIVNAHGGMADLDPAGVWMVPDEFDDGDLISALSALAQDPGRRAQLGRRAEEIVHYGHAPEKCGRLYFEAIESIYRRAKNGLPGLSKALAKIDITKPELIPIAQDLARNFPPSPRRRQLLVDISGLVHGNESKSDIERVVRAVLREWMINSPSEFHVEPVYAATETMGYRFARRFTSQFLGVPGEWGQDEPVEAWPGDIFIGLDLQPDVVPAQQTHLKEWMARGVRIWFIVYDLLPILQSEYFSPALKELHTRWLEVVGQFDGLLCISKAVANETREWLKGNGPKRDRPLLVEWFHPGGDVSPGTPPRNMRKEASKTLDRIREHPTFLMVGTLESYKGHALVLDAFESLWRSDIQCNLVIVGKQGWMVEPLVERLRKHPESKKRLFWLKTIGDEYLKEIFAAGTCLISASHAEGFCLPIIQAAQHKLPIIARDIPAFREVAGNHAFYFKAQTPEKLMIELKSWLESYTLGKHPKSEEMPWLKWPDSAAEALQRVLRSSTEEKLNFI